MIRVLWLLALLLGSASTQDPGEESWVPGSATPEGGGLSLKRAGGGPALLIREDEELTYLVEVSIGPFRGLDVGKATFKSRVEGDGEAAVGHLEAVFKASHLGFKLDHRLHTQHTQGGDIMLKSSDTQRGSDNRRREIHVERRGEGLTAVYRYDGHCKGCEDKAHYRKGFFLRKSKHCKDCDGREHRVWREPREREVPEDTLDFLSSIYLIRAFISEELEGIKTPLLEKDRLWDLSLKSGEAKDIEVPMGKYACRKIIIEAQKPVSESHKEKFSGLFGMKGSMNFWVHESTGVMVQIAGDLPLGLGVKIRLQDVKGAPAGLVPKGS